MGWFFKKKKTEKELLRDKLINSTKKWSELTQIIIVKKFSRGPEDEIKKIHDEIEGLLDDMYNTTRKLKGIGDVEWLAEFKKEQENKSRGTW